MSKIERLSNCFKILREYTGRNPYILMIKRDLYVKKTANTLTDFQIEYIEKNFNYQERQINKVIKITRWYGENRKEKWETEFIPEKLQILWLLGETDRTYHCIVKYRQSVNPVQCFIPKKAVLTNFFYEDYHNVQVDFQRYDNLSTAIDPNRKLMSHQKEGIQFLLSRKKCILADDMGLGKTMSLSVAAIEGNFDSVLIICPASLKNNWKNELMWYVKEKDITVIDGFNDKNKSDLESFLGYSVGKSNKSKEELLLEAKINGKWQNNRFVIINYDILDEFFDLNRKTTEQDSPLLEYIKNRKSLIIIDEAHNLSNGTSTRYKIIKKLINVGKPNSVYLSTGTPITNNPLNFFYLLQLIENEITSDYKYYIETYCDAQTFPAKGEREKWTNLYLKKKGKNKWGDLTYRQKEELNDYISNNARMITTANGATNLDELKEKVSHIYLRRVKEDLNDLPQKYIHELYYDLNSEQRKEYERLWDEYEQEKLKEDETKELNKDLLEGAVYRNYLSLQAIPYTIKMADKMINEGKKVVIMCCFDEELYTLRDYYKDKCVIFNGKCSLKQKDSAVEKFMKDDSCMVFIGNIIAASVGITLTSSYNLIFNDFDYVPSNFRQACDRIHRKSQTKDCHIYIQLFNNTHNEHVWNTIISKQAISDSVIVKENEKD